MINVLNVIEPENDIFDGRCEDALSVPKKFRMKFQGIVNISNGF